MFVQTAHAASINEANKAVVKSQIETSKIKTQLKTISSERTKLKDEIQLKVEKIQQLEQENAELKG